MYALGEKYGIERLKKEAAWRFQENLKALRLPSKPRACLMLFQLSIPPPPRVTVALEIIL